MNKMTAALQITASTRNAPKTWSGEKVENRRIMLTHEARKSIQRNRLARWQSGDAEDCKSSTKSKASDTCDFKTGEPPAKPDHVCSGFRRIFRPDLTPALSREMFAGGVS